MSELTSLSAASEATAHVERAIPISVVEQRYLGLSTTAQRVYTLASCFAGPDLSYELLAAASEEKLEDVHDAAAELVSARLFTKVSNGHFQFIEGAKAYARTLVSEIEAKVARRISEWLLHQITRANMVVIPLRWRVSPISQLYKVAEPAFKSDSEAVDWLDGQLPNIIAVLNDLVTRGSDDLAWQLGEALWELFLYRRHYPEWIQTHEIAIAAAQRCGEAIGESRLRCQIGQAYIDLCDYSAAERETKIALNVARELHDKYNESVALQQYGVIAFRAEQYDHAISLYRESMAIEVELHIPRGVALRHYRIAEVLIATDRLSEAREELETAYTILIELADHKSQALILTLLGKLDARQGNFEASKQKFDKALRIMRAAGGDVYLSRVLIDYGDANQLWGEPDLARKYYEEAFAILSKIGNPEVPRVEEKIASLN